MDSEQFMSASSASLQNRLEFRESEAAPRGPDPGRSLRFALIASAGMAAVALLTFCAYKLQLNLSTSGSLYLLIVVVVSIRSGFWEASIVSLLAVMCLDYFFTAPAFTFYVSDPQNWVALATFEATALIVSRLSTRARIQARREARHRLLLEKVYDLSRRILLLDRRQTPGPQIVFLIKDIFQVEAAVLFDASEPRVDATGSYSKAMEQLARTTYLNENVLRQTEPATWQRVLRLGSKSIGAIVLSGGELNSSVLDAIASLAAIALERARSFDAESRSEAARQSEQLRAAVLDALAHAFKTPLTAIRTASSGLLETGQLTGDNAEMVDLIDKESERLNQLASRLLQTARIDEAHLKLHSEWFPISSFLEDVLAEYRQQLRGHDVRVSVQPPDLSAYADRQTLASGLGQLIDNAAKYSHEGSPIGIFAQETLDEVVLSVHNEGPAIPPSERERIFERFYRTEESKHRAAGTGLGLSIAKRTAEAHLGRVWVVSEENKGVTFFFALPRRRKKP